MKDLAAELARLRQERLYRQRRVIDSPTAVRVRVDGRDCLSFCSNDYLGLANHPDVIAALQRGAERWGVGSGASHLITGHSRAHHALEEELAAFTGRPRALLFSTGYMANVGVITALMERGDTVYEDKLNHASLLDGAMQSAARLQRYPHNDVAALGRMLDRGSVSVASQTPPPPALLPLAGEGGISSNGAHLLAEHGFSRPSPASGRRARGEGRYGGEGSTGDRTALIVTDGVFSMDGDLAPLPQLSALARERNALLMVDDAHGLGVIGTNGGGVCEQFGLGIDAVPILVGTLGKAFGTFGAFVAGSDDLIEYLLQRARSYIYTTAMPAAVAEATRASLQLAIRESWRREHVHDLIARFHAGAAQLGLTLPDSTTPIQPLIVGDSAKATALSAALLERGILISAIRPPTVAVGTARLRITFSAAHTEADVDQLLAALETTL